MKTFFELSEKLKKDKDDPCWKGYVQVGMKKKNGKEVPNCVPKEAKNEDKKLEKDKDDPCWKGYVQLGTKKKNGKEVPNCVPKESVQENKEDKEPASPDEASMAMKQAEFIQYVGREVGEHIKAGKEFPEWMQNKLTGLHEKAKSVHASLGAHGGEDDVKEERKYKPPTPEEIRKDKERERKGKQRPSMSLKGLRRKGVM